MTGYGDLGFMHCPPPAAKQEVRDYVSKIYVVIPVLGNFISREERSLGGVLLRSIRLLSTAFQKSFSSWGEAGVIAFDAKSMLIFDLSTSECADSDGKQVGARSTREGEPITSYLQRILNRRRAALPNEIVLFVTTSFLLLSKPNVEELFRTAFVNGAACAGRSAIEIYALAIAVSKSGPIKDMLPEIIEQLSSHYPGRPVAMNGRTQKLPWVRLESCSAGAAPATFSPRPFDAPAYLNRAIAEALFQPSDKSDIGADENKMRLALIAQRDVSAVPWLFNELLNSVEHRAIHAYPESIPPEVHMSISGVCNLECRFCSYSHESARKDRVSVSQLFNLDFLRHVRTLRLHSGNGEPTVNSALSDIIQYVERTFPWISMTFFTNGVLLDRPGLVRSIVGGQVAWISVSINSATRDGWRRLCNGDHFDRISRNLMSILEAKQALASTSPIVYGSMVLTKDSVHELPLMPKLCRQLGIDRFTAIPFFSLGYERADRLSARDAYHHFPDYDHIYAATVAAAAQAGVSIELPSPHDAKAGVFGIEKREFFDFAGVEPAGRRLDSLLDSFPSRHSAEHACHYLWRQVAIGSTTRGQTESDDSHFLYPCLGPLAAINYAPHTAFRFTDQHGFQANWRNRLFTKLRKAQAARGIVQVCDACRANDSRAPENIANFTELLRDYATVNGL